MGRAHFLVLAALVAVVAVAPVRGEDEVAAAGPSLVKVRRRGGAHPGAFEWLSRSAGAVRARAVRTDTGVCSQVLTDSTFEHDTQAVTGATTGDWFVEFYAPWVRAAAARWRARCVHLRQRLSHGACAQCGHCKRLEDIWEKLASKLGEDREAGEVVPIIAKVDGTIEKALTGSAMPGCQRVAKNFPQSLTRIHSVA